MFGARRTVVCCGDNQQRVLERIARRDMRTRVDDGLICARAITTCAHSGSTKPPRFSAQRQESSTASLGRACVRHEPALPSIRQRHASTGRNSYSTTADKPATPPHQDTAQQHAHFSALASSWWDAHGPSRLLHLMNPMRHQFINMCLQSSKFPPSDPATGSLRYLDVGCGGGIFAESAARLSSTATVLGVDPNPEVLQVAREHAKRDPFLVSSISNTAAGVPGEGNEQPRLKYSNSTLEDVPLPNAVESDGYDVVTLFEVIEHLPRPAQTLDHISRQLKAGGLMVLSTIARTWTSWATTKVVAEDLLGMVPRGTHDWEKYLNWNEIQDWLRESGEWNMQSLRVTGVVYVPGFGWKEVPRSEDYGNYFLGVRKK